MNDGVIGVKRHLSYRSFNSKSSKINRSLVIPFRLTAF